MQVRVITLRFAAALDGFDDGPLREFVKDKEVHAVREYFFQRNDAPYLAVVVTFTPPPLAQQKELAKPDRPQRDESWRETLKKEDEPIFESLRTWRSERSKADGVPPYVVFTNKELAEIVTSRPATLASLAEIEGIGRAKCEKYGLHVLGILAKCKEEAPPVEAGTPSQETPDEG